MINISVVIITFNEEKNIERCLSSISQITDDIIVVDSFSTDDTENICRLYKNVNFVKHEWLGYAEQKNFGNTLAKNDWILSIDADEVVSDVLINSISSHYKKGLKGVYACKRLTNFCGTWIKHSGWYPDVKARLFNRAEVKWQGLVHEAINHKEEITLLEGDLLHYSYYSIHQLLSQINKFTDIAAEEAFNKGKKAPVLKIIVYPIWKFIRDYIVNAGFLDGFHGFVVCISSAYSTFVKYVKIRELYKNKSA